MNETDLSGMAADDAAPPENALGYEVIQGGLNNQKLALYGLFLKAFRDGPRRVVLPDFMLFDQVTFDHRPVPFHQAMHLGPLRAFAARHGIEILDSPPIGGKEEGWDYFHFGNNDFPRAALLNELGPDSFACDFFRSLVPVIQDTGLPGRLAEAVFGELRVRLAVQLRIERDWADHIAVRLAPKGADATEHNDASFREIIAKVAHTLPAEASRVYVICDEAALPVPRDEIRRAIQQEFGIALVWKSDLLAEEKLNSLSVLDRSILDFEMAVAADVFVGLTRSTFSNMAAFERYARTRAPVERHFVYNAAGPNLAPRHDNGAFQVPALAIAADPWASVHGFYLGGIFEAAGDRRRALEQYAAHASRRGADREEVYISLYRAGHIKATLGFSVAEVTDTFLRAADVIPTRSEALYAASRHYRLNGLHGEGYAAAKRAVDLPRPPRGLFLEPAVYDWAILDEYAVNAFWADDPLACADASLKILESGGFPANDRPRVMANLRAGIDRLKELRGRGADPPEPSH